MYNMNNKGQVGIVVAILVISLMVAFLVIIQTYYVPQWMKEREAEHMDVVANQFASLKYSMDLQAMEKSSTPLINSITLGSKELPFFLSSRAFGSLQVLSWAESNFSVAIEGNASMKEEFYEEVVSGNISNIEEINKFAIKIENLQNGRTYTAISPYFNITVSTEGNVLINIHLLVKNGTGGILFNDYIESGNAGEVKLINLMNSLYNISSIISGINQIFNVSINCSAGGKFIVGGYKYGDAETVSFPPLYIGRMGEIKYSSQNAYFVDQDYIYEGGALILEQRTGGSILHPPLITFLNGSVPYINITLVNVKGMAGKTGVAGYGTYPIRTNYSSSYHAGAMGMLNLTISTNYKEAWRKYLERSLNESGISYTIEEGNGYVRVSFDYIKLDVEIITIYAQIGPGWVVG